MPIKLMLTRGRSYRVGKRTSWSSAKCLPSSHLHYKMMVLMIPKTAKNALFVHVACQIKRNSTSLGIRRSVRLIWCMLRLLISYLSSSQAVVLSILAVWPKGSLMQLNWQPTLKRVSKILTKVFNCHFHTHFIKTTRKTTIYQPLRAAECWI